MARVMRTPTERLVEQTKRLEVQTKTKPSEMAVAKGSRGRWRTGRPKHGVTVTCSFTLTPAHDQLALDMAAAENVSRSEIVRRAIVHLATCPRGRQK